MKKIIIISLGIMAMLPGCFVNKVETVVLKEKGKKEDQELIKAIVGKDLEGVIEALRKGANKDFGAGRGMTVLMWAASEGHASIVKMLIEIGVNKDAVNENGDTALMMASFQGYEHIVKMLIEAGANKDAIDKNRYTALLSGVLKGHVAIVKMLIEAGANKDVIDKFGMTALMVANFYGYEHIVKMLIEAGANKDVVDKFGRTALLIAVEKRNYENIKLLYSNMANLNTESASRKTPIGLLCYLAIKEEEFKPLFISIINYELKILGKLLKKRFDNLTKAVKEKLEKTDDTSLKTIDSLKALTMVMGCDSLIRNEIFKNVVEMSLPHRYILKNIFENTELKIDERIFEICLKYKEEEIKKFKTEDIINLFIIEITGYEAPVTGAWCIIS